MGTRTRDMTAGKPLGLIFSFSLPLMLGSIFQQGYMIVDAMVVGRGVGVQALASLGASDWINWMFLWAIHGFTHGFSVLVAQAYGARAEKGLRKTVAMLTLLCIGLGLLLTILGLLAIDPLLLLLRTEASIIDGSRLYLRVLFVGTIAVFAYNMAAAILRSMGDSRTPLIAMVLAAVINIALDLLFVLVFHWGIFGAAFATVLAQAFSFVYCLCVMRRLPALALSREDWQLDRGLMRHLMRYGLPIAFQNSIIAIGGMVVQYVLNGFGFLFVAGFTATNKLYGVLESAAISFGYAMTAYMGQNQGARRVERIDAGLRAVVQLSIGFSVVISLAMILFGRNILGLFVSAREAGAEEVIGIAYQYLLIMSYLLLVLFLLHAYRSSLQGLGNVTVPMLSGIAELVMRIATALLLPRFMGADGIFFAEVAAWCGAAVCLMSYYHAKIGSIKHAILAAGGGPQPHTE